MNRIRPELDLAHILPLVQMPGRYTGGEFGISRIDESRLNTDFLTGICFPDLYEIGMSNTAIKLLYTQLNQIEGVLCERVFAPAPDFELLLKEKDIPLYTLESGIPLSKLDILGFSVGYELSATGILTVLDRGHIPIFRQERDSSHPIVIGGGPALTNPAPFQKFFDAIFIGEAEEAYSRIVLAIRDAKTRGADRTQLLEILSSFKEIWMPGKKEAAERAIWQGFDTSRDLTLPVQNISVVQDHAVIEIMRGCPNGCRFCHAGIFYRPFREKSFREIVKEADFYIYELGFREITLSSLSTGDYHRLHELVRFLNARYQGMGVSFALPSLRVNSFTLPLLQELSKVRKSGLTFAVETPDILSQKSVNKEVHADQVVKILDEARERGWNMAKFYFMIGLPSHLYSSRGGEAEAIAEYLWKIRNETGFKLNVNIGTFIPKPHTPYQWSAQLGEEEALDRIRMLREEFKKTPVKISYHSPFISLLEGVVSRGDARVGDLIVSAYRQGARLDAWEEHVSIEIWKKVFADADWDVEHATIRERSLDEDLPWDSVDLGVKKEYLKDELEKSIKHELTETCVFPCTHHCGVCVRKIRPTVPQEEESLDNIPEPDKELSIPDENVNDGYWYLFTFSKTGPSRYVSHINIMTIFERAFQRAGLRLQYTQGFNPKPRIDFAHPLSLGISSQSEVARCKVFGELPEETEILQLINSKLPMGISVHDFKVFTGKYAEGKGRSLMALHGGSSYRIRRNHTSNSGLPIQELYTQILAFLEKNNGSKNWLEFELDNESIRLFVPSYGKGKFLIKNLYAELSGGIGDFLSHYDVERTGIALLDEERELDMVKPSEIGIEYLALT